MKKRLRILYIILVGLIVFTGALMIVQGTLTRDTRRPNLLIDEMDSGRESA